LANFILFTECLYTSLLQAKIPVTIFFSQYFLGSTAVLP
jgi:hypothetical protein